MLFRLTSELGTRDQAGGPDGVHGAFEDVAGATAKVLAILITAAVFQGTLYDNSPDVWRRSSRPLGVQLVQPHGPSGDWNLIWRDEFGTWNPDKWTRPIWHVQNVDTNPNNSWVYGGNLVLNLSSRTSGALVRSTFRFEPGMVAEARVKFPGNSSDPIFNWPGWWAAGFKYPQSREHDIAEGLARGLKVSYWDQNKRLRFGVYPSGNWGSAYHYYTLWRRSTDALVYWDGRLVARYSTNDDGRPEALLLSLGSTSGETPVLEKPGRVRISYVRVWRR